ncbi:MAG: hypothetical protein QE263_04635 [Vampirovibrionales bacterium]|nr:hypothetical protein [Vampirovibrionales bacterium]
MATPQKIATPAARLVQWSPTVAEHLGQYLTPQQLNGVFYDWYGNRVALWGLFSGNTHVGTLATRIDVMLDKTRHWVFVHAGGKWIEQLKDLQSYFEGVAHHHHCHALRLDLGSGHIARIARERLRGFTTYEVSIVCPLTKRGAS